MSASRIEDPMMQSIRRNLSFANVTSMAAVMIALGGTSYAAVALPKNSVSSKQIKAKSVKNSDLGANSITTDKVKNGTLVKADFAVNQLSAAAGVAGARGATGAPGAAGAPGAPGPAGVIGSVIVHRTDIALPAGASAGVAGASTSGFATCAAGQKLIGGSASIGNVTDPPSQEIVVSRPAADDVGSGAVPTDAGAMAFWKGTGRTLTNVAGTMRVFAFCAVA
jgi:hypothetical protein